MPKSQYSKLLCKNNDILSSAESTTINNAVEEKIMDTGRLFLRNLPYSCTEEDLVNNFKHFGPLAEVECIVDKAGQCKGYALCTFMFPEHALAAWKEMDGKEFMGRKMHIIAGEEKVERTNSEHTIKTLSTFQRERFKNLKESANRTQHTWNSLFLGTNAVADTLTEKFDVEKRHLLLDQGEQSAAVRIAMAETRLVRETRKFLSDHGVRLDVFSKSNEDIKRSKTVIIVKNLTGKSGECDRLSKIFSRFGDVKNVIMPAEHAISALVEMANEWQAKKAFKALAYSKKSGQPMYLEWAPVDVFDEKHPTRQSDGYIGRNMSSNNDKMNVPVGEEREIDTIMDSNTDEKKNSEEVSNETEAEKSNKHTKILVRNVPFQAIQKEITQLFSAFGELKFVRMPKKPGGEGHRGFCFVDFISIGDARRAMEALAHSTHLYGRRLVLEWAKEEETLDELRGKVKRKSQQKKYGGIRKEKMRSFAMSD